MRQVTDRHNREHADGRPGAWRRGWPVLLALFLLVTGGGLSGPGGLVQALRGVPHAGAGAGSADTRDPALLRSGGRQAVLAQRSADPAAAPAPLEPALAPEPASGRLADGRSVATGAPRVAGTPGSPAHSYQARAPPATA
ncbi:hypothetical protein RUR49_25455 [Pseudoxanthobacter sp. M-2]|uniref:hypothetical protein n=1 Tax=Pseudoxanthobacter sp. M-2 TaxID=3078754 RepID=UPI0038FCDACB